MTSVVSRVKGLVDFGFAFRAKYLDSEDSKFFRDGFGDTDAMEAFDKKLMAEGEDGFDDIEIEKTAKEKYSNERFNVFRGSFVSPAKEFILDESASKGEVEIIEPVDKSFRGVVVLVPMTGDEGYSYRRTNIALPLAEAGFVTISLMVPFYGKRRAEGSKSCNSPTFNEFCVLYWSAFLEVGKLVTWAKQTYAGVAVGISGLSQGGIMTVNGSTYTKSDVVLVPVVAGLRMYEGFRDGVMSAAVSRKSIRSKDDIARLDALMKWVNSERSIQGLNDRGAPKDRKVTVRFIAAKSDHFIPTGSSNDLAHTLNKYATKFSHIKVKGGHATTIKDAKPIVVPEIIRAFQEHEEYAISS